MAPVGRTIGQDQTLAVERGDKLLLLLRIGNGLD